MNDPVAWIDAVTAGLVWLLIGSIIWMLMFSAGIVTQSRREASNFAIVLVSAGVIIAWPLVVLVFIGGVLSAARRVR
jgi:hypothetical protein